MPHANDPSAVRGSAAHELRTEIAAAAARLIVEDGCDWASAKRKAAQAVLGERASHRATLPERAEMESAVRAYLRTYQPQEHRALLAGLRRAALMLMRRLENFDPHLTGAVLNGTATEHSDLRLALFCDSAKDVELALMEAGVDFEAVEGGQHEPRPEEVLSFLWPAPRAAGLPPSLHRLGVHLEVYGPRARRQAPRPTAAEDGMHPLETLGRAGIAQLEELLEGTAR
jgi:hypothetical protein